MPLFDIVIILFKKRFVKNFYPFYYMENGGGNMIYITSWEKNIPPKAKGGQQKKEPEASSQP